MTRQEEYNFDMALWQYIQLPCGGKLAINVSHSSLFFELPSKLSPNKFFRAFMVGLVRTIGPALFRKNMQVNMSTMSLFGGNV